MLIRLAALAFALLLTTSALAGRDFEESSSEYWEESTAFTTDVPVVLCIWLRTESDATQWAISLGDTGAGQDFEGITFRYPTDDALQGMSNHTPGSDRVTGVSNPTHDQWYHFCFRSVTDMSRYVAVDGAQGAEDTTNVSGAAAFDRLCIGCLARTSVGTTTTWDGVLAWAGTWAVDVEPEIFQSMSAGAPPMMYGAENIYPLANHSPGQDLGGEIDLTTSVGTTDSIEAPPCVWP